ncbi:MAG: ATP-binding protein, partial [Saprospiraceae bacterium]
RFAVPISISIYSRLFAGQNGQLWLLGEKSMLAKFDPSNARIDTFDFSPITGYREAALSLNTDANGHLWIGTPHGLVHGIPNGNSLKFALHKNNPNDRQTMSCNSVLASLNDPFQPDRYLWLGTKGGGLNCFDKRTGVFKHFTSAEGLPNNVVYAILPDSGGKLWLSTNRGLSKFDPATGFFQNFFSVDGLQDNEFNTLSFAQAADGRLYFGGVNGITAFYPSELDASFSSPSVFINQLKVNNLPVKVGDGILEKSIEYTNSITLSYQQNQLTFEFVAMDFSSPRMNQFRYRLLGSNEIWMESAPGDNSATFTNLASGDYVFEVITGGSRGIWDGNPARLSIRILPPWWRTGWAYTLYFLICAGGIWALYNFQVNKIRLKNKLAFEHNEALRLAELDRLKTNFFSSITHEFRTPLTLLLEPARQLLQEAKTETTRFRLELIEKNARRLLQYVNQLLDLSKLEAGKMPLDLRPGNLASTVRAVVEQFLPLAQQRSIRLDLELPDDNTPVILDELKFEQVVSNLLSNALKFTDNGGVVLVKLSESVAPLPGVPHLLEVPAKKHFNLEVSDTGIGISAEDLPNVFDRFFQTEHTRSGTGIGLSLTKELVERMGGTISVRSKVGVGTTFMVQLPCEVASIQTGKLDEHDNPKPGTIRVAHLQGVPHVLHTGPFQSLDVEESPSSPLLLLIEDDADLRKFLRASLPSTYRIAEAVDGAEGLQMATELTPDLVISDLMMPKMDGFEVAETLKSNPGTSHIPIILLTAKSALETKIEGLQRGADAYLTKPFRADELVAHIENLLTSRRMLQVHFSPMAPNKPLAEQAVTALPAAENEFLQQLIQLIDTNLDNEAMDADAFARAVFISRSQLHRKISALTGLSLTEFVRNHRLDRARDMLTQGEGSIAEIAWRVGFPNAKYFSTCFKERFGVSPSGFVSGR